MNGLYPDICRSRYREFAEFARIAGKRALVIAPYRDVNSCGWQRATAVFPGNTSSGPPRSCQRSSKRFLRFA